MGYETVQSRYTAARARPADRARLLRRRAVADRRHRRHRGHQRGHRRPCSPPGSTRPTARTRCSASSPRRSPPAGTGGGGGLFALILGLVMAAVLLALLLTYIVRVALTIVLIAGAPIALMFHALPHTDGIARWWWRTFAALLAIQLGAKPHPGHRAASAAVPGRVRAVRAAQRRRVHHPAGHPRAALHPVQNPVLDARRHPDRLAAARSLGSLARGFVAYKTFGLLTGRGRRRGRGDGGGGRRRRGWAGRWARGRARRPDRPIPTRRARATAGRAADAAARGPRAAAPRRPIPPAAPTPSAAARSARVAGAAAGAAARRTATGRRTGRSWAATGSTGSRCR